MKKILCFILVLFISVFCLVACGNDNPTVEDFKPIENKEQITIGMICLHDNSSTYDANFIDSMYRALDNLGISHGQLRLATGVSETEACYNKAAEFASECNIVFADSFGHEDYMLQAAQEFPNVRFCHATGEKAAVANLPNFSNAFAAIYEGRYLAGIAAGIKLNEMNEGKSVEEQNYKIGYIAAYQYAEVISGYTAFYLGARSVCPQATMLVTITGTWYDFALENAAAGMLIAQGCALISQHADSYGAPTACENAKVPNVSYNGSTYDKCKDSFIVSSKIDWTPYFEYIIKQTLAGEPIAQNWVGTIKDGAVKLTELGDVAAAGTQEAIDAAKAKLIDGTLKVFDTSKFTVNGKTLTLDENYKANVLYDEAYTPDTNVILNENEITFFAESYYRSAPYFDLIIDGITVKGEN